MSPSVLFPIPKNDFDPTETAIPWKILTRAGIKCYFSTSDGRPGQADQRMLYGTDLGILKWVLAANADAKSAYEEMSLCAEFKNPVRWDECRAENFTGILLAGGHAPGMKEYLESKILQN